MSNPPIWIVRDKLKFEDIIHDDSRYISAWLCIVEHWLIEPAQCLAEADGGTRVVDRGISLLMLILSFFEPLGSNLTGESSRGSSREKFVCGFTYFCKRLDENDDECENKANLIYDFARCGLMHSLTMRGGKVFIDAYGIGKTSICRYDYKMPHTNNKGGVGAREEIYLIDPWRLIHQLRCFCRHFHEKLNESKVNNTDLYGSFKMTFEREFVSPGKKYFVY